MKFDLREDNVKLLLWIIDLVLGEKLTFRRLEDGTRVSAFDSFKFEPTLPFYIQAMTQYMQRKDTESFTHLLYVLSPDHDVLDKLCNVLIQQFPQDETAKTFYGRLGLYKCCFDNSNFRCPITINLMRSPVIAASGHSYENSGIVPWLSQSNKDPKTNEPLPNTNLVPNLAMQSEIDDVLCAKTPMSRLALDSIMREWDA